MTGINLIDGRHGRSTSSNGALRSGSPSGATRSSTWNTVVDSHGTARPASAASISAGVEPPLNATDAAATPPHRVAELSGDPRCSLVGRGLRIGSDDDVHEPFRGAGSAASAPTRTLRTELWPTLASVRSIASVHRRVATAETGRRRRRRGVPRVGSVDALLAPPGLLRCRSS